jgi:alpha-beta hydrolase superfamily lysophospholipase
MSDTRLARSVLFVHGPWLHASSWGRWVERFADAGYAASAPGWPGDPDTVEAARADPASIAGHGIDDVVAHLGGIITRLDAPPVLIGHGLGGTIVQKLLGLDRAAGAVAIDAAPIRGVLRLPISSLRSAFPVLRNPANRNRAVALTPAGFRYAFGSAISAEESDELHRRWAIPAPGRPLFQVATASFNPRSQTAVETHNSRRGPLLLTMGGRDHAVPRRITKSTLNLYKRSTAFTALMDFPDRGHSLVIDSGWRDVAEAVLGWLADQGL